MINLIANGQELSALGFCINHIQEVRYLSDPKKEDLADGLERKKEQARKRAKDVRDGALFARRKRERTLTPGVKIVGSRLLDGGSEDTERSNLENKLKHEVTDYLLRRGGFEVTEEMLVDTRSNKRDTEDVMDIQIARIIGFHEKWGLDRRFLSKSIFAHRFENGVIFEHSLISYGGYVSRTYYVVEGNEFRAFAQRNFRKSAD